MGVCHVGVGWVIQVWGWGMSCKCGVGHTGVGWGYVMQGWGGSCRGGGGVCHEGVGWGMSYRGGTIHTEHLFTICILYHVVLTWNYWESQIQLKPHTKSLTITEGAQIQLQPQIKTWIFLLSTKRDDTICGSISIK